ncbi:unnamed protein product [Chironomus riparius]|uniref:Uncharacterized protein n=1 Tax=Chironomus riparius TaxID=315576 RepID=A0A9N9RJ89_9DIPT|nr:unnamed protein product [Chironomus riparius]
MSEKCQIMWEKLFLLTVIILMISPSQSAIVECNWSTWSPDVTYCMPYNITPLSQPNEAITINGKPSNYIDPNVTALWFSDQVFNYMPSGLFILFPSLSLVNFERCKITSLTTDSIPSCGMLNSFGIRGETFPHIPAGLFQSCKSITFLNMANNNITTLDVDAFRGLTNITMLDLSYNKIACVPPGLFQHNPILSSIYLYQNLISAIDSNLFANLPNLNGIMLGNNLISFIPKMNLTGSNSTWLSIGFDSNPIYAITPDFCSIFEVRPENHIYIYIFNTSCNPSDPNNMMSSISSSTCQNYTAQLQNCYANWTSSMANAPVSCAVLPPTTLAPPTTAVIPTPSPTPGSCPSDKICRYFLDQYNRYTCILDGVDSVLTSISGNHLITFSDPNVRRVIFTNSFLSRIPPILFQKFPSLEYLTVSNCSMSAINTNTFSACGTLKYFDASSNFITTVDGASFKSCAALEVIDLTGNNFDMISGQLFVNNPMLKAVYINRPPAMVLV